MTIDPPATATCTLVFPIRNGKVLLSKGMRGVNSNRWNGYGGKVDRGDASIEQAAIRELEEESGLVSNAEDLHYHGWIRFIWDKTVPGLGVSTAKVAQVHIFTIKVWSGEDKSTESMATPTWFEFSNIPYSEMAPDNPHWLPRLLEGRYFTGDILYSIEGAIENAEVNLHEESPELT